MHNCEMHVTTPRCVQQQAQPAPLLMTCPDLTAHAIHPCLTMDTSWTYTVFLVQLPGINTDGTLHDHAKQRDGALTSQPPACLRLCTASALMGVPSAAKLQEGAALTAHKLAS